MKRLGFGFMRLPLIDPDDPTSINKEELKELIDIYMKNRFNYFDTAHVYHKGVSEKIIKELIVDKYPRDEYIIADKLPIFNINSKDQMETIFQEQLDRLGVNYIDYYMIHNASTRHQEKIDKFQAYEFIKHLKDKGYVKHIGISCHDGPEFIEETLKKHPEIEFIQLQINYLDWNNKTIDAKGCYDVACKYEKPVIVMEPIKGGSLINVPDDVKKLFKSTNPDKSLASWAFDFDLNLDNVFMILSGMNTKKQLEDNIHTTETFKKLTQKQLDIIKKAAKLIGRSHEIPCTFCGYCLDGCPEHINIPKYFDLYNTNKILENNHAIMYYENYTSDHPKPSACIECGNCMKICPQRINIIEQLKNVTKTFN